MKNTKSAIRLDPLLIQDAEIEANIHKRTTPKQIEYWADIGRKVSDLINPTDLLAISQGLAHIELKTTESYAINPDEIFSRVEEERASGYLSNHVTRSTISYQASQTQPGLLDRINADGSREAGHFKNGKFVVVRSKNA